MLFKFLKSKQRQKKMDIITISVGKNSLSCKNKTNNTTKKHLK